MAIGVFKLTKKQRHLLSIIFISLNCVQIATGIIMISLSLYIYISVAPVLYSERAEITYVFTVIGICGINNTCNYLFGMRMCQKCVKQAHKKSTKTLMFVWSCVSFYIILYLILLSGVTSKVYKHVIRSMKHSLHIGMTNYLTDNLWKITIDRIQYDMQCCGIKTYDEWHKINWLKKSHLNDKAELVKQLKSDTGTYPVTPWSCCRVSFPMQCLHDPLQQVGSGNVWVDQPSLIAEAVNTEGCIQKLKVPIRSALTTFILLVVLNCIVQVFIFIVSRLLYTSQRNAILLDDPDGVAPGWIFGRGDCGYNRGKTLADIMELNVSRKQSASGVSEKTQTTPKAPKRSKRTPKSEKHEPAATEEETEVLLKTHELQ